MQFLISDEPGTPRICPKCGEVSESPLCKKDGTKTFYLNGVAGRFVELRKEFGPLEYSQLIKASKFGYNVRTDFNLIDDLRAFHRDLILYFQALVEISKPNCIIFGRDQRQYGDVIQSAFEEFSKERGVNTSIVYGPISTTMMDYLGGFFSFKEKKEVLTLQITASHNPPNYNGIKASAGRFPHNIFASEFDMGAQISAEDVTASFVEWCTQFSPYEEDVVFDLNNGAGNVAFPKIAERLYSKAQLVNNKLLADFGGLKPEPGWYSRWSGFGVTFDGDADRSPFYNNTKMIFFSRWLAGAVQNDAFTEKKVVADQRIHPALVDYLKELGVKVILGDIGNVYQARIAEKENALWFEENWHSGGYTVGKYKFFWWAAPFAVTYWLDKLKIPVDDFLNGVPDFNFTEERFKTGPGFNQRAEEYADKHDLDHTKLPSGGIRIDLDKGHIVLRESNTEIGTVKLLGSGLSEADFKESLKVGRKLFSAIEGK